MSPCDLREQGTIGQGFFERTLASWYQPRLLSKAKDVRFSLSPWPNDDHTSQRKALGPPWRHGHHGVPGRVARGNRPRTHAHRHSCTSRLRRRRPACAYRLSPFAPKGIDQSHRHTSSPARSRLSLSSGDRILSRQCRTHLNGPRCAPETQTEVRFFPRARNETYAIR
jgi:hypothetical protein